MTKGRKPNLRSSVYEGPDGRWHGWVTVGVKSDGSPDRRHRRGATEAEVTRKIRDLERQRDTGGTTKAGVMTVEVWLRLWLDTIAVRRVRRKTLKNYRAKIERWIIPVIGKHRLDRLQPEHVEAAYAHMEEADLSPNTVLQTHRILSRALKVAMQRRHTSLNVCTLIDAPRAEHVEHSALEVEDVKSILDVVGERRNAARWLVALAIGLRQSEALGLQWRDVDLDRGIVRVRSGLHREAWSHGCEDPAACTEGKHRRPCPADCPKAARKSGKRHVCVPVDAKRLCPEECVRHAGACPQRRGGFYLEEPKSKTSRRTIALPDELVAQLRQHRVAQLEERLEMGSSWVGWEYDGRQIDLVFARPDGQPISSGDDWAEWQRVLRLAGVPRARVHDARHTAATLLLEQGVDIRVVMDLLGHASIQLTANTYQHVTDRLRRDAADAMSAAIWGRR